LSICFQIPETLKVFHCERILIIIKLFCLSNKIRFFVKHFGKESVKQEMKKSISISLALSLLITLLHFSVATHYCGGTVASARISLSGKLASCGMEKDEENKPLSGTFFVSHCCYNHIAYYNIANSYHPTFSHVPEVYRDHFRIINIPKGFQIKSEGLISLMYTSVSPPGESAFNYVKLCDICVYRI
jgi:hypothetical protein